MASNPFKATVVGEEEEGHMLIDGSNPGYIILFCTTSQVYSLECIHNGLTHHTVSEEEKEEPRRGHSPHTSGSPPRNIPLRNSRGQLALAKHSHPIDLLQLLRKKPEQAPVTNLDRHIRNQRSPMLELVKILGEFHGFRDPL